MATALEVARDVYSRFAEGDIAGFLNLCSENIEWVVNGPATLEKCGSFRGRGGVQEFLNILGESWEFSAFTPKQFLMDGPTVVVLGEEQGKDKRSGVQFENRWVHVLDVKDGQVIRFREFLCHWPGDQKPPAMTWDRV
ncbi:MAG: nuclear transport factor 2 family protein [Pseudomonadota bacterium]|nr:nuclear transport factor 2 family protein [Pseudomonadota bacterium]